MDDPKQVEARMAAAAEMQEAWTFVLDCLDGQVSECQRHGWDLSQSRSLVFASFLNTMLKGLSGPTAP